MITSVDQLHRTITLSGFPQRIVSVVPSQTELLFTLGLNDEVVGITKFCIHPHEWFRTKERIGGTKKLNVGRIKAISPDLIIANKEENTQEDIDSLSQLFPVWISDIKTLDDAIEMISRLGELVNRKYESQKLINSIHSRFRVLNEKNFQRRKAVYLVWKDPVMTAGSDTFISHLMTTAGFENVITAARYPEVTIEIIKQLSPHVILLSSEPFPFTETHAAEIEQKSGIRTIRVNGEMFSWYGSRLLQSPAYFIALREVQKL
jgi:ABC-type Fe3+-hydroxamate transport system substrate-binding protein